MSNVINDPAVHTCNLSPTSIQRELTATCDFCKIKGVLYTCEKCDFDICGSCYRNYASIAQFKGICCLLCSNCGSIEYPGCSKHTMLLSVLESSGEMRCSTIGCSCSTSIYWKNCRFCNGESPNRVPINISVREAQYCKNQMLELGDESDTITAVLLCSECGVVEFPGTESGLVLYESGKGIVDRKTESVLDPKIWSFQHASSECNGEKIMILPVFLSLQESLFLANNVARTLTEVLTSEYAAPILKRTSNFRSTDDDGDDEPELLAMYMDLINITINGKSASPKLPSPTTIRTTHLWIICGSPGSGKSTMVNNLTGSDLLTGDGFNAVTTTEMALISSFEPHKGQGKFSAFTFTDTEGVGQQRSDGKTNFNNCLLPIFARIVLGCSGLVLCLKSGFRLGKEDGDLIKCVRALFPGLPIIVCITQYDLFEKDVKCNKKTTTRAMLAAPSKVLALEWLEREKKELFSSINLPESDMDRCCVVKCCNSGDPDDVDIESLYEKLGDYSGVEYGSGSNFLKTLRKDFDIGNSSKDKREQAFKAAEMCVYKMDKDPMTKENAIKSLIDSAGMTPEEAEEFMKTNWLTGKIRVSAANFGRFFSSGRKTPPMMEKIKKRV